MAAHCNTIARQMLNHVNERGNDGIDWSWMDGATYPPGWDAERWDAPTVFRLFNAVRDKDARKVRRLLGRVLRENRWIDYYGLRSYELAREAVHHYVKHGKPYYRKRQAALYNGEADRDAVRSVIPSWAL